MSNLFLNKEIVKYYKELNGIKFDIDLLKKIGTELNYKFEVLDDFIKSQKGNFSKMLKGLRPLNTDYIVPLEKIFGVSMSKLVEPDAYKFLINKEDIPYLKGIKYYAYMDDMDLYINELSKLTDNKGELIIFNKDEYGKSFIDYIAEYNSINAVKYLYENLDIKLKWYDNYFSVNDKRIINMNLCSSIPFVRMIASLNDAKLFSDIYDTYNMFITNGHYGGKNSFFEQEDFLRIILDNEHLFKDIFKIREYMHICSDNEKRKLKKDYYTINTINPIINVCLRYALNNLDKYKEKATKILNFAIKHNSDVINKLGENHFIYKMTELGGIYSKEDDLIDILIYSDIKTEDYTINKFINQLPKYENGCFNYYTYKNMNS